MMRQESHDNPGGRGYPCKEVSNKLNFKIESIHSKNLEAAIQSTP